MENHLVIFLKFPEPGKVKTRIGTSIGHEKAATIYKSITSYIVNNVLKSKNYKTTICFEPRSRESEIRNWFNNNSINLIEQVGDNLGTKIINIINMLKDLNNNIVIIGSDCIDVNSKLIERSFEYLADSCDIVIGPANDGGYYLIGISKSVPDIFCDIEWSTDKVFSQTLNKIKKNELSYKVLEKLNDIDEVKDIDQKILNIIKKDNKNFNIY